MTNDKIMAHANKINHLIDISKVISPKLSPEEAEDCLSYFDKYCAKGMDFGTAYCFAYDEWKKKKNG